jgi:hypothetical protein
MNTTTRTPTSREAVVLLRALALVVAERDGIHPVHAENRVRAACRLVDAADDLCWTGQSPDPELLCDEQRNIVADDAGVQASADTWRVAADLYRAEQWEWL